MMLSTNCFVSEAGAPGNASGRHVVFVLDARRYALPMAEVERIVQSVEYAPVPGADATVHGVMNLHGVLLPVLNLRRLLGLPEKPVAFSDHFIVAHAEARRVALVVDRVVALVSPGESGGSATLVPGAREGEFALRYEDTLASVCRMAHLFPAAAEAALHGRLTEGGRA